MKFLVIERHRETLTKEVLQKIAPAMFKYHRDLEKAGKGKHYVMAGQPGGVVIFDVESNEELARLIASSPVYRFTTREIIPLWEPEPAEGMLDDMVSQIEELEENL